MKKIGVTPEIAEQFKKDGIEKFREQYQGYKKEVEEKKKKNKSTFMGNLCCGFFILIFFFFLFYSKLNEEFWRLYKTRGQEIEVPEGNKIVLGLL